MAHNAMPLTMAKVGEEVKVIEVRGGQRLRRRLIELGFTPGARVRILQDHGGPLLLAIGNSRLAMGRGMAHKILVTTETPVIQGSAHG